MPQPAPLPRRPRRFFARTHTRARARATFDSLNERRFNRDAFLHKLGRLLRTGAHCPSACAHTHASPLKHIQNIRPPNPLPRPVFCPTNKLPPFFGLSPHPKKRHSAPLAAPPILPRCAPPCPCRRPRLGCAGAASEREREGGSTARRRLARAHARACHRHHQCPPPPLLPFALNLRPAVPAAAAAEAPHSRRAPFFPRFSNYIFRAAKSRTTSTAALVLARLQNTHTHAHARTAQRFRCTRELMLCLCRSRARPIAARAQRSSPPSALFCDRRTGVVVGGCRPCVLCCPTALPRFVLLLSSPLFRTFFD